MAEGQEKPPHSQDGEPQPVLTPLPKGQKEQQGSPKSQVPGVVQVLAVGKNGSAQGRGGKEELMKGMGIDGKIRVEAPVIRVVPELRRPGHQFKRWGGPEKERGKPPKERQD